MDILSKYWDTLYLYLISSCSHILNKAVGAKHPAPQEDVRLIWLHLYSGVIQCVHIIKCLQLKQLFVILSLTAEWYTL